MPSKLMNKQLESKQNMVLNIVKLLIQDIDNLIDKKAMKLILKTYFDTYYINNESKNRFVAKKFIKENNIVDSIEQNVTNLFLKFISIPEKTDKIIFLMISLIKKISFGIKVVKMIDQLEEFSSIEHLIQEYNIQLDSKIKQIFRKNYNDNLKLQKKLITNMSKDSFYLKENLDIKNLINVELDFNLKSSKYLRNEDVDKLLKSTKVQKKLSKVLWYKLFVQIYFNKINNLTKNYLVNGQQLFLNNIKKNEYQMIKDNIVLKFDIKDFVKHEDKLKEYDAYIYLVCNNNDYKDFQDNIKYLEIKDLAEKNKYKIEDWTKENNVEFVNLIKGDNV